MANNVQLIPNMVQGVTQQAAQESRNSQCQSQFDMLNQPVQGAVARPGFEWVTKLDTGDWSDAFFYNIMRSRTERYVVGIKDGSLSAWNLIGGVSCTVSHSVDVSAYLTDMTGGALDWDNWAATTANDTTFLANKQIKPAMDTTKSPARNPEAMFWFRAGGYKVQYTIGIKLAGTWYNWSYTTPDNSTAANAQYIATDALCYALYNAMLTDVSHPLVSGTGNLGFNAERYGNIMRIWRTDGQDFDITTSDGLNNTQLTGIKGKVGGLDQLPVNGFDGFTVRVSGDATDTSDDWYAMFDSEASAGDSTTQGGWVEVVASNTPINLKASTMPLVLFNDAINHFTLDYGDWGARLAGDGIDSAKDPSFVGQSIADISYDQARLMIMTDFSAVWSRVKNPFVFFPDTVQVSLATAPIDSTIEQTKGIAILKRPVQTNGYTYLWAEDKQLVVSHGDNSVFSNDTIEVDPSSAYAWNEDIEPQPVGLSLLFATSDGSNTSITDAVFQQGQVADDTGVTDHVPNYLPNDCRQLVASDTAKKALVRAASTPNLLYLYEYRKTKTDRLQSAWNTWRLPDDCNVLHMLYDKSTVYALVGRSDGLHLLKVSTAPNQVDAEGGYKTRLDFQVTEADCTVTYDSGGDTTTVELPYKADDTMSWLAGKSQLSMVIRTTAGDFVRGNEPGFTVSASGGGHNTRLLLNGDWTAAEFYAGFRIRSERTESTFYRRDDQTGYVYAEAIHVGRGELLIKDTAYSRTEVVLRDNSIRYSYEFEGKVLGTITAQYDTVSLYTGKTKFSIGLTNEDHNVRFVNDTPFPSAWQGGVIMFNPTIRTAP